MYTHSHKVSFPKSQRKDPSNVLLFGTALHCTCKVATIFHHQHYHHHIHCYPDFEKYCSLGFFLSSLIGDEIR
jgi:hypothetical protein